MTTPRVAVVMAVYNGAERIAATLQGLVAQTMSDWALIIVDDGSTDDLETALLPWRDDPRIHYHRAEHAGLTRSLIRGCRLASAPLIARHDCGDVSAPDRFERQCALFDADPKLAFVGCRHAMLAPGGEVLDAAVGASGETITNSLRHAGARLRAPHHGSVMMRRDAYEKAGGYRAEFWFAQDVDLWTRLIEQGGFAMLPEVLYSATLGTGDISSLYADRQHRLEQLIFACRDARQHGESEADWLAQAAVINDRDVIESAIARRRRRAAGLHYIASRLTTRDPAAARQYLRQALANDPFRARTWWWWLKLLGR